MKTHGILLSLLLLSAITVQAQFKQFNLGLKAAPQISWIKPNLDSYEPDGAKLGFSWGFIGEYNFTENHSFGTGFNVVFNGGKLAFPYKSATDTGTMHRNYMLKCIEIPLTLKMRTNSIGNVKYYGQIGLATSFNIDAKNEDNFVFGTNSTHTDKATYNKVSFIRESLIIGLGAEYTLKAGAILTGGFAFNNGFTDILTGKTVMNQTVKEKAVINFIELNLGVLF